MLPVFLFALFLAGCQNQPTPQKPSVSGKVVVTGQGPLTGGTIQFVPTSGPIGTGLIGVDGTYLVADAPKGECRVVINNQSLAKAGGKFITPSQKFGKGIPGEGGTPQGVIIPPQMGPKSSESGTYMPISDQFANVETTPLRATLQQGANTIDFEVK